MAKNNATPKPQTQPEMTEAEQRQAVAEQYPLHVQAEHMTLKREGKVRAQCNLQLNGCMVVRNVRLMQGDKGLFVSMPAYNSRNGYKEHVFPINSDARQKINDAVKDLYNQEMTLSQQEYQQNQAQMQEAPDPFAAPETQVAAASGQEMTM